MVFNSSDDTLAVLGRQFSESFFEKLSELLAFHSVAVGSVCIDGEDWNVRETLRAASEHFEPHEYLHVGIKNVTYEERRHSLHVFGTPTRVDITWLTIALGLLDSRTEDPIWDARIYYMAAPSPNMLAGHIVEAMDADDLLPYPNQP